MELEMGRIRNGAVTRRLGIWLCEIAFTGRGEI